MRQFVITWPSAADELHDHHKNRTLASVKVENEHFDLAVQSADVKPTGFRFVLGQPGVTAVIETSFTSDLVTINLHSRHDTSP